MILCSCAHVAACHITRGYTWCRHSKSCLSLLFRGDGWLSFISVLNVFNFTAPMGLPAGTHSAGFRHQCPPGTGTGVCLRRSRAGS